MAFIIKEDEENNPLGLETLRKWEKPIATADDLADAVLQLNKSAGGKAFVWIDDVPPRGIESVAAGPDGLTLNAMDGGLPPPLPAQLFAHGLQHESNGDGGKPVYVKDRGEIAKIGAIKLQRTAIEGDALYVVAIQPGEAAPGVRASKSAEVDAPLYAGDVKPALDALVSSSGRPGLAKEPLFCSIPSVPSEDGERSELGTICVVDVVWKKGNHVELDLMGVTQEEAAKIQNDPGEQSAGFVADRCAKIDPKAALFFMYRGKPYAATDFGAGDGLPPLMTLEPWENVDESEDTAIGMLAQAASADGLFG